MALHISQQIVVAFAGLVGNLTTTGTRVFTDRIRNLAETDLPALRIFDDSENIQNELINDAVASVPYMQRRTIVLTVEAVTKENTTLDATLNLIKNEVEKAIAANSTLGGLCKLHCTPRSSSKDRDGSCEVQAGKLTMTWHAIALTMSNTPDVPI